MSTLAVSALAVTVLAVPALAHSDDIPVNTALQWQFGSPEQHAAAIDLAGAWAITPGAADTVIAVIDTGVLLDHPEFTGRWLPGYDFVSADRATDTPVDTRPVDTPPVDTPPADAPADDTPADDTLPASIQQIGALQAGDGDGRDADPSDPGDGILADELDAFHDLGLDCRTSESSWHGTAVASIIAANAEDLNGIHGIDRRARVLPVRAVGRCGGRRSDLLDAIRWSAGLSVPGVPDNPYPAHIINLSLGMNDDCSPADQQAIDDARAAGAVIVAALGNGARDSDIAPMSPSHCRGVIGVAAVDAAGDLAAYSNHGFDADIAAPGGERWLPWFDPVDGRLNVTAMEPGAMSPEGIVVAGNTAVDRGLSVPGYLMASGTSIAVPHVSGVLALMRAANPTLGPRELEALLLANTRAFPVAIDSTIDSDSSTTCRHDNCGTGLLDAGLAVRAAMDYQPGTPLPLTALDATDIRPVTVGAGTTSFLSVWLLLVYWIPTFIARRRKTPAIDKSDNARSSVCGKRPIALNTVLLRQLHPSRDASLGR